MAKRAEGDDHRRSVGSAQSRSFRSQMVDDTIEFETDDIPPASAASDTLGKTKTLLAANGAQHRQGLRANECAGALRLGHRDTPASAISHCKLFKRARVASGLTREIDKRAPSGIAPSLAFSRMLS